ncbi:MAG: FKBP-type peptidyl-prolyl cis-trans isomerase [Proteobacteria bacterium]|nr:FKBP-type peptidyl-prolyl cis-trans isomerase [Pseudomonadota bacterium]
MQIQHRSNMLAPRLAGVLVLATAIATAILVLSACQKGSSDDQKETASGDDKDASKVDTKISTPPARQRGPAEETPPMDVAQPPANAQKTESGMHFVILAKGKEDKKPGRNDTAMVHYTVWRTSGQTIFSNKRRGRPQTMPLWQVPDGWGEMLSTMSIGEKRLVWMPSELASRGGRPRKETYVFEMELASFESAPPVPSDVAAPPADAQKTSSGLAYKVLKKGTGSEKPRAWDDVTVHSTGWSTDGRMFENTATSKRPQNKSLFRESPGLAEAIQLMVAGQKNRIWIPANLLKKGPNMPEGMAVYDIELVSFKKKEPPPAVPKDVAAPPKDAKKTAKGVFYKLIKKAEKTGTVHPKPTDSVKVHYTGWTTDGNMFDSSVVRGQPAQFSLSGVIAGWTDGLQVMVVGETTRFWIPEELAYKGKPGAPQGMLVFDVELLEIKAGPPARRPPHIPGHGQKKPGAGAGQKPKGAAQTE